MTGQCSIDLLQSALAGALPADDEAALHRHLEACEACCAALEQLAGGSTWGREAAAILYRDELDDSAPARDEWSDVDFTVEHLEPADDPSLLGRLGGYDVLEIIGRGGMGVVLKGYDRELKRSVAIKVLAPHLAQSSLARKRFTREAQAAAAVVHPHVLAIHQVQPAGRLPFLVMPLVAGESLAERLAAQGTLELKEILRIGMQAASGLAAAHEQGLVHRDVKPANILLEKGIERAVLTDFGLARAGDDVALTRWGIIAGTPQYMSPEQVRGEPLDGRSDLFSLGCVLYEMATGVSPFRSDSMMATMRRLVDDAPPAIASRNPELPRWFIALVDRLLRKDPTARFDSAKEVSELLESCLAHMQQPASAPLPAALTPPEAKPAAGRAGRRAFGIAAALALFGVVALGVMLAQSAEPPDISGPWTGDEWGQVELKKNSGDEYTGSYSRTVGKQPGEIELKWSPIERRFNGVWREGKDRFGEISVRLLKDEIRGALTTDVRSKINPATPRLADLAWTRGRAEPKPAPEQVALEPPVTAAPSEPPPPIWSMDPNGLPLVPRVFSQIPAPIFHDGKLEKARNVTYFALEGGKFRAEGIVGENATDTKRVEATGRCWRGGINGGSLYLFWFDRPSDSGNDSAGSAVNQRDPDHKIDSRDRKQLGFPLVPVSDSAAGAAFGPVEDGLQLALELDSRNSGGYVLGEPIDPVFYLRNVSDRPARTAVGGMQSVEPKIVDEYGKVLILDSAVGTRMIDSGWRRVLVPNADLPFRGVPLEFIAEDQDKPSDAGFDGYYVHVRPGRYSLSYQLRFPDGGGMPSDWSGELETAPIMLDVKEGGRSQGATVAEEAKPGILFGPAKNDLQTALEISPRYGRGNFPGEPFHFVFMVRNASEKQIDLTAKSDGPKVTDEEGRELPVRLGSGARLALPTAFSFAPGSASKVDIFPLRFFEEGADAAKLAGPESYYVIAKPGTYKVTSRMIVTPWVGTYNAPVDGAAGSPDPSRPPDLEAGPITVVVRERSAPAPQTKGAKSGATKNPRPAGHGANSVTLRAEDGEVVVETPTHTATAKRIELGRPADRPAASVPAPTEAEPPGVEPVPTKTAPPTPTTDDAPTTHADEPKASRDVSVTAKPRLQFRLEASEGATEAETLNFNGGVVTIATEILLDGSAIASANATKSPSGDAEIELRFTDQAARKIDEITAANSGKRLAILFDGRVLVAPIIRARIGASATIAGRFSAAEIKAILEAIQPPATR